MEPDVRWVGTETGKGRSEEWSVVPIEHMDQNSISKISQNDFVFKPGRDLRDEILGNREKIYNTKALIWYPAETDVSIREGCFTMKNTV